jgi:hypothetical protein
MIFSITTCTDAFDATAKNGKTYKDRDYRTVGYYFDKGRAVKAVEMNEGDIQEKVYRYAIIEAVPEGVYPIPKRKEEQWYEWNVSKGQFEPCNKPSDDDLQQTVGFALG